ncbi:apurinic endonuclease Apn1 [mine drainage metagenome]|uniref:Apurinic endonuclease Apn1 n=1 Tax=mine drainage metagenome TaxID=410659 RepID=T0Y5D4_9ZZZZ
MVGTIDYALRESAGTSILLENSAGYTNSLGSKIEEIGDIIKDVGSNRVGMCLDTCHTFAAGYDISSKAGAADLMDEIDMHVGLGRVKLVHLNDAKFELGSGLDRHWHIGKGHIGIKGFVNFFSSSRLPTECFVMETPENDEGNGATDMRAVFKIMRTCGIDDYTPKAIMPEV